MLLKNVEGTFQSLGGLLVDSSVAGETRIGEQQQRANKARRGDDP
jgi:hypothetical protein